MFTPGKYAIKSISKQGFRSMIFFLLVFLSSACLYGVGFFIQNMQTGIEQVDKRIGADMIAVPSAYSDSAKDALFAGEACTIFFRDDPSGKIAQLNGIANVSSQLYLETLSFDCCAAGGVQIIAFDPETDFTVSECISGEDIRKLSADEIIAGYSSGMKKGSSVVFFGKKFTVAYVLDETGMGYDQSVFVSYEAADKITSSPEYNYLFGERTDLSSMILIRADEGYDTEQLKESIEILFDDVSVYTTDALVKSLNKQLDYYKAFGNIMGAFVVILAAVSLFALVTITFYQRRSRVGSLLSVGICRSRIVKIFLLEYLYLTLLGTVSGAVFSAVIVLPLHNVIKQSMDLPYKFIGFGNMVLLFIAVLCVNILILLIACSVTLANIIRTEPAILTEEQL